MASNTDVILFNIDSKADNLKAGREAILTVFLKVLNELQGFCADDRGSPTWSGTSLSKGKLEGFKQTFHEATGASW